MPRSYTTRARRDEQPTGEALPVAMASDALLEGWTRERVLAALISRIQRDDGYLAYRRACERRTSYDAQVHSDMRALPLAACWLDEPATGK